MKKAKKQRALNGGKDKFYTKQYVADYFSNVVYELYGNVEYIEPTAGNGSFLKVLPNIIGYDIAPERSCIIKKDVFTLKFKSNNVVVGNPPFGTNASLAIKIFNYIATFNVKAICFIVPKTFKKVSIHDKLNLNYHLILEQDLLKNSFVVDGIDYDVPCVFQIWEYKNEKRRKSLEVTCDWLDFVDKSEAEIAVRRVGGRAGQVLDGLNYNKESTYFIKVKNKNVLKALRLINYKKYIDNTAGIRSISKKELCFEVDRIMGVLCGNF